MTCDILTAGVGGQGVLSVSAVIASAALRAELCFKQCEVHGMAQRGGAVLAHLRLSDAPIHSSLISRGSADLILGLEPLESLRYLDWLSPQGWLLAAADPVRNIPDYPDLAELLARIRGLPRAHLIEAEALARAAGAGRAANMVLVGAAAHRLPVEAAILERCIRDVLGPKGPQVVELNLRAFRAGAEALLCRPS
jgi:indolepyruvate ferredoxin oxidoreductase beta subunit